MVFNLVDRLGVVGGSTGTSVSWMVFFPEVLLEERVSDFAFRDFGLTEIPSLGSKSP
jgi:hypothetical protein